MQKHHTIPLCQIADDPNDKLTIKPFVQDDIQVHDHNCFELAYVTGGHASQTLNGVTCTVREGDYFIIDHGSCHSYHDCRDFTLINCLFLAEIIDHTLTGRHSFDELLRVCLIRYHRQYFGKTPANRIFHDTDGRIHRLLLGMQQEYEKRDTGYLEIIRGRLMEILILTMRQVVQDRSALERSMEQFRQNARSNIIFEAVRDLESHYREKAVLGSFCREYHYSLPYVSRRFKQETGLSAQEYLQKIRIEKCCALLAGDTLPIQTIAQMSGYEDMKFFNRIFKRMTGLTPREYRKTASSL